MRDIKFRVWDKKDRKFRVLEQISMDFDIYSRKFLLQLDDKLTIYPEYDDEPNTRWFSTDEVEVMQYTGLKDKNGKEIYEGDILIIRMAKTPNSYPEYVIVGWDEKGVEWMTRNIDHSHQSPFYPLGEYANTGLHSLEVISNIYENPELLSK